MHQNYVPCGEIVLMLWTLSFCEEVHLFTVFLQDREALVTYDPGL